MERLTFSGASDDGTSLVVTTDDGTEFALMLTDQLRRAAATVRPRSKDADAEAGSSLTPKEIQQRIRAGLTAPELAELSGEPVEALERYAAPVLAERAYIVQLAQGTRIGREADAPVLGDLVTDRLAGRGVDPEAVVWDAWREVEEPWMVAADYRVDGRSTRAQWEFDHSARALTALDDEARWLSETELLDVPIPTRHLAAVRSVDPDAPLEESRPPAPSAAPSQTELLLDDLDIRRGTRDGVDADEDDGDDSDLVDEVFEGFGPARARQADVGFTASATDDAGEPSAPTVEQSPAPPSSAVKPSRKGRASVPSWDEIVFGAKHDG